MKNSNLSTFDKSRRGLSHYEKLKEDISDKSKNILISLPLFVRLILTDKKSWFAEFNKYDLLCPISVHSNIDNIIYLADSSSKRNALKRLMEHL